MVFDTAGPLFYFIALDRKFAVFIYTYFLLTEPKVPVLYFPLRGASDLSPFYLSFVPLLLVAIEKGCISFRSVVKLNQRNFRRSWSNSQIRR